MTVAIGTAGHIDHGKTALLRALTGIDADRLPEERRRGMTIDVGYAHLALPDGSELDFVDVPGHDRLVGNMLVGAGEVDAAMLVVAVDDGPRAQTFEHLELLDALGIAHGLAVVTKIDLCGPDDARPAAVRESVGSLLARTSLAGAPVVAVSAANGEGLDRLVRALVEVRDQVAAAAAATSATAAGGGRPRLAVDRAFVVHGRGVVVTGTLRGGPIARGDELRVEPGSGRARVREIQVHGETRERVEGGGRVALNLAGVELESVRRGVILTADPEVVVTDRLLVELRPAADLGRAARLEGRPFRDGVPLRLHLGTAQVDARIRRNRADVEADGRLVTVLHLAEPVAVAAGDRFALRRPSPALTSGGGRVLDPRPPVGPSRRRLTHAAVLAIRDAGDPRTRAAALVELHGAITSDAGILPGLTDDRAARFGPAVLAGDLAEALADEALAEVAAHHAGQPQSAGLALAELRPRLARSLRRRATIAPPEAAAAVAALVDDLVRNGRLARDGDLVRDPRRSPGLPAEVRIAMDRLEATLALAAPPPFMAAVRATRCPPEGIRALEASGRIVRLEPDLAYAAQTYGELEALALRLAAAGPLSPAIFRDATKTSRRYALAILEDLDRRGLLRRTPDGHLPGPRAPGAAR